VAIELSASHAAYDLQLVTSARQHRVVYGAGFDSRFRPATALWVATGEPIGKGARRVTARADTHVVVATTALGVSDDRARAMALAASANRP
jgi:molybdopterin biosynthesis enzyme